MRIWLETAPLLLVWVALIAAFVAAAILGKGLRRLAIRRSGALRENTEAGYVVTASLGLLSLLVAFTFNVALNRYETRRDLIVAEANAIRSVALRAELLAPDEADRLLRLTARYADSRIAFFEVGAGRAAIRDAQRATERLQEAMWAVVLPSAQGGDRAFQGRTVVDALNPLFAASAAREAAAVEHIPATVLGLLIAFAVVTASILGYAGGALGATHLFPKAMLFGLLASAIVTTMDLDRPRSGGVQVSQAPILAARAVVADALLASPRRPGSAAAKP